MPYTAITLTQAQTDLSARLADPTQIRWVPAELTLLLQEALRVWNGLAGYFRDVVVIPTVAGVPFYDLSTTAARGMTVTDATLVTMLEYRLLEPPTPTAWTGSTQFTLNDLVQALQRRRDQFLLETGLVVSRAHSQILGPTMGGRYNLPETTIAVRRVALNNGTTTLPLIRDDTWSFGHFTRTWPQHPTGTLVDPFAYSVGETPPLVLQVVPPISLAMTLDLVSLQRGAALNPSGPVAIGVPDDWAWAILHGALADLLGKDGLAADPGRSQYADQRWQVAVQVAKTQGIVWSARVNDVPVQISALQEADAYQANWQTVTGQPNTVLTAGGSLIALSPVPDGVYSVTLDVLRNAPVPVAGTDVLQVGSEVYDVILDLAEHAALFKEGAETLQTAQGLLDRAYRLAGVSAGQATAQTPNKALLTAQGRQDEIAVPRETAGA